MNQSIENALSAAINTLQDNGIIPQDWENKSQLTRTKDQSHGDFASNIAMVAAKVAKTNPRALAQQIVDSLPQSSDISKVEIAGPGFINFFLNAQNRYAILDEILNKTHTFGFKQQTNNKIIVEFVSANPTGPLHVGHGRQAALGDAICNLLTAAGNHVHREFYYNDAGVQIENLGLSVQARVKGINPEDTAWPEAGYRGDYIADIADDFKAQKTVAASDRKVTATGDADDIKNITEFAVTYLRNEQDLDLKAFALKFDNYYLESSLYKSGKVDAAVNKLIENGVTYEKDGALWLKTTDFGDDKDRVMRKKDGGYTYFVPDVAYHLHKFGRGFSKALNIQGTDHHGTIARVRAGIQAASDSTIPDGYPDFVLHTMVRVVRGGEEVKISKRAGSYITLRDLIEWTSKDAVRFFLLSRKPDTEYTFDVDLAIQKNNDNPVFYVQYAHARVCRVFEKLNSLQKQYGTPNMMLAYSEVKAKENFGLLTHEIEVDVLNKLAAYPDQVLRAAKSYEPHLIVNYLRELVSLFHSWYDKCRILPKQDDLEAKSLTPEQLQTMQARLALSLAVKQVIANGLDLLGVDAPESM